MSAQRPEVVVVSGARTGVGGQASAPRKSGTATISTPDVTERLYRAPQATLTPP